MFAETNNTVNGISDKAGIPVIHYRVIFVQIRANAEVFIKLRCKDTVQYKILYGGILFVNQQKAQ